MGYFAENGRVGTFEGSLPDGTINITSAQYASALAGIAEGKVVSVDGGKFSVDFPPEPDPTPDPEPQPEGLPSLEPWQFRAMLKLSGKQDDLYAFIEAMPEPHKTVAQSKLEYSLAFHRDNDLVQAAQQALGLTNEELDGLWLQAAGL